MAPVVQHHMLAFHPAARPDAIGHVSVGVSWQAANRWVFDFLVAEPPAALNLPAPSPPGRADELWRTTCFELFLRRPGDAAYFEFNFSPSGLWAAYAFEGYREGGHDLDTASPLILTADRRQSVPAYEAHLLRQGHEPDFARVMAEGMETGAGPTAQYALSVSFDDPAFHADGPWLAGLSAVIEEAHGPKSYWALAHPSAKPDFHHPDSFVLELP